MFLFCATAFGVVLTLGGLRYSTVETEIYLLTTQFLDLQAAAALSLLQLVVVTGLLYAAHVTRTRREHAVERAAARSVARPVRRRDAPVLGSSLLALVLVVTPVAHAGRSARCGWTTGGGSRTTARSAPPAAARPCWSR